MELLGYSNLCQSLVARAASDFDRDLSPREAFDTSPPRNRPEYI